MVIWKRSSATSLAKTSIAPSMLIRSRRSVTQSGLRGALSSFGARAEQISIRRFQTRWNGAVSFLPSLERCSRLQNRSRTCVRIGREEACCERVVEFRDDDGSFSIYAYVQIFLPLDSRTKGVGRGRKDEETRV